MYLAAYVTTDLLDTSIIEDNEHGTFWCLILILIADSILWTFFFINEFSSFIENPVDYFYDPWNFIDVLGILSQASFMMFTVMKVFF